MWDASPSRLAAAYGTDVSRIEQLSYSLAEQIHQHYCLSRGIVNHSEARPDQQVALSVLASLAGADWWMVRGDERASVIESDEPLKIVFMHSGGDAVGGDLADDSTES
jgi:hypothetical protein